MSRLLVLLVALLAGCAEYREPELRWADDDVLGVRCYYLSGRTARLAISCVYKSSPPIDSLEVRILPQRQEPNL